MRSSAVALSLVLFGCGGPKAPGPGLPIMPNVITAQEIESSKAANAYDVIKKLRGNFLSYRGRTSMNNTSSPDPVVFVDDQAYGPLASLRTIPAAQIETIRLYRTWEAQTKYGRGLMGGAIAIETKQ
ncbi:MAG TPA: TonB-dependent receptor plug domain-containing protein [Gemmatimonadaceae bacterium]